MKMPRPGEPEVIVVEEEEVSELWQAAAEGNSAQVQRLLEHCAEVGWADAFGNTALHCACTNGFEDITRLLLAAKASVDQTNRNGATARQMLQTTKKLATRPETTS